MFLKSHKLVKNKKNRKLLSQYYDLFTNSSKYPYYFSSFIYYVCMFLVFVLCLGMVLSVQMLDCILMVFHVCTQQKNVRRFVTMGVKIITFRVNIQVHLC